MYNLFLTQKVNGAKINYSRLQLLGVCYFGENILLALTLYRGKSAASGKLPNKTHFNI